MYYALIVLSVLMFGGCFALQDVYRGLRGSSLKISMESAFLGSLAGLAVLLILNGFALEFTPFTLLMASLAALNGIAFTFFSFRALDLINLSLFSVFSMLGGMVLPFLQGILFYGEPLTVAKILCLICICLALLLTVSPANRKGGTVFYVGIFVLNGMSGVLSKLFTASPYPKTSAAGYSMWIALVTLVLSGILWLALLRKQPSDRPFSPKAGAICASQGAINRVANFLLVIALAHVDTSVQYPMVTGGVIIVSTQIALFGPRKPSRRELCSVLLAFAGMLLLFVIPI